MNTAPVTIVGLGCIGGSLARALTLRGASVRAWSDSSEDGALASAAGIAVSDSLDDLAAHAGIVVLAIPLPSVAAAAARVAALAPDAIILHTAGLQRPDAVALAPAIAARVVGTHPIAGSHAGGFAASRAELFRGAPVSIESRAGAPVRLAAESMWRAAGAARFDYRSAEEHDALMVWMSHLPQLAATALAAALAEHGLRPGDAGPGARDSTRLAASPPELWLPLLRAAPADLDAALAALESQVSELRRALASSDGAQLARIWEPARAWRRAVDERV